MKEVKHKRVHAFRFHLYEDHKQAKRNHGDRNQKELLMASED